MWDFFTLHNLKMKSMIIFLERFVASCKYIRCQYIYPYCLVSGKIENQSFHIMTKPFKLSSAYLYFPNQVIFRLFLEHSVLSRVGMMIVDVYMIR